MKSTHIFLILVATAALGAINPDGSKAIEPVSMDDPSPIADPLTYIPDQHDCPLPCLDYANVHKWTPYHSIDRLQRCELPMLLHFSVLLPLDDPDTDVLIRGCTLGTDGDRDRTIINATSMPINNPKNRSDLFESSLDVAPACAVDGTETTGELEPITSGRHGLDGSLRAF